ncbi:MAG: YfcC family protein [Flavobacteriales bacterium]|nr:YfcC family protein [Flavobacteriales bacterium]
MKKLSFPAAHTVLLIIAALVAAMTWLIPAGQYDRLALDKEKNVFVQTGIDEQISYPVTHESLDKLGIKIPLEKFTGGDIWKPVGIPNTYHQLEPSPQGIKALVQSPLRGIMEGIDVILFVIIIGGFIGVVNHSGAFDAGMNWLAAKLKGRESILIILITGLIAIGGTTFGLAEETIAFYPILVPIFLVAGYDAMVALAAIYIGSSIGSMVSTVNPFSVIIASDAAGINWTTGIYGRLILLVLGVILCLWYIIRYANKVQKDPSRSLIYDQKAAIEKLFLHTASKDAIVFNWRIRLILLLFITSFVVMILGVSQLDWWFLEMTTVFFIAAIIIGVVAKLGEKKFISVFIQGSNDLLGVALIIGFARGVTVLMDEGLISDTLLFYASGLTEGMNKGVFVNAMMFIYAGLSFFIPSSSGMAVLTMPIMAPLADGVGVGREMVVNAYQCGMGIFSFINPTGLILASLAMVEVGFDRWMRFVMPLVGWLTVLTMLVLTIQAYI